MIIKQITILFLCLTLAACTSPPPPPNPLDGTDASLAEASYAVSRSITSLSATAEAAHPAPNLQTPPDPASYGMGVITSIDWSGPVEPLLRQMAKVTHYHLIILGTEPAIP